MSGFPTAKKKGLLSLLLFYAASLAVMRFPELPLLGSKLQFSDMILLLLLGTYCAQYLRDKRSLHGKTDRTPLLIPALFLPSFFAANDPVRSGIEWLGILSLVILYIVIVRLVDDAESPRLMARAFF